jgi:uncharacterized protein with PIN domain
MREESGMSDAPAMQFVCDAMLGGLARWLRAAGYDAAWRPHGEDWDLIRQARAERRVLLSSDAGIFRIGIVRDGDVPGLFVPHGLPRREQLRFVLHHYGLPVGVPRCMACGGGLVERNREEVCKRVPPRSLAWQDRFWECRGCGRLFWQGTHWQRIEAVLRDLRK